MDEDDEVYALGLAFDMVPNDEGGNDSSVVAEEDDTDFGDRVGAGNVAMAESVADLGLRRGGGAEACGRGSTGV